MMDQLSRAIGALEASVKGIQQSVESQGRVAAESREHIYQKLEEGAHEFAALRHEVATVKVELEEIVPAVKRFERARQQAEGSQATWVIVYAGLLAFATGLGYAANFAFEWIKKSH